MMRIQRYHFFLLILLALSAQTPLPAVPESGWESSLLVSQMGDDLDPQWSPDGSEIAFVGHEAGNPEVYLFDTASGEVRNLSNDPLDDYRPFWSPDGRYVAFSRRTRPYSADAFALRISDLTTGEVYTASDETGISRSWWQEDTLLYIQGDGLVSYDLETHQRRHHYVPSSGQRIYRSAISNDGSLAALLLIIDRDPNRYEWNMVIVDAIKSVVRTADVGLVEDVVWSPDNRHLAYVVHAGVTDTLYILDAQTLSKRIVE